MAALHRESAISGRRRGRTGVVLCAALAAVAVGAATCAHALEQAVPFLPGAVREEQTAGGQTVACLAVNGFFTPVTRFESRAVPTEIAGLTLRYRTRLASDQERKELRTTTYAARTQSRRAVNACRRAGNPRKLALPWIQSIRPRILSPGVEITVRGRNLDRVLALQVSDIGVPYSVLSPTQLTFRAPRGLPGPGYIAAASQLGSTVTRGTFGVGGSGYRLPVSTAHNKRFPADVNMDGVVDQNDLSEVRRRLTVHWSAAGESIRPDMDGDSRILQGDLLGIQAYLEYLSMPLE